jgi:hypothetical protein
MAVFLFVTACMALFAGFVGLVAGCRPQTTGRKKDPRVSVASWSSRGGIHSGEHDQAGARTWKGGELWDNDRAIDGPLGRFGAQLRGELFARADGRTAFAAPMTIHREE